MQNEQQIGSNDHFPGFFPNLVFYEILLQRDSHGEHMQKSMVEFYGFMAWKAHKCFWELQKQKQKYIEILSF